MHCIESKRAPREVIRWAMCKLGVEEWLVSAVMSIRDRPKFGFGFGAENNNLQCFGKFRFLLNIDL